MAELQTLKCDVLVIGSGAGGLTAAITARLAGLDVIVVEKEAHFGGTTARSGGVLWIPENSVNKRLGVEDSSKDARRYIQHEAGNLFDAEKVDAFLEAGPRMVSFFESKTDVRFLPNEALPDYHPDAPGAVSGGRSIVAAPFSGVELGTRLKDLQRPLREITFFGMMFNVSQEIQHFFRVTSSVKSAAYVARRLFNHSVEVLSHGRATRLTNGNALAARLAKSCFDLDIPIMLSSPALSLTGNVEGAMVRIGGQPLLISATRGVILACGGFPLDTERRKQLFPHAPEGTEHKSPAAPGNQGDGLRMAEKLGALVEDRMPNAGAWIPVSVVRHRDGTLGHFPHLIDRYKPGIIAVLSNGQRFVNEADSYHDFGQAMITACSGGEVAAWLVCDERTIRKYGMGFVKPRPLPLFPHLRSGYLVKGNDIAELARKAGIDPAGLEKTVTGYNVHAVRGQDPQFNKGGTAYNRYLGDPTVSPNPCVAPLTKGPFYAIKVVVGDLGTFAGLRTDSAARVLDGAGKPIPRLYAVGNDMASIMCGSYPGGGITLGPAMTFGYIAANHIAAQAGLKAPLLASVEPTSGV